MLVGVMLTHFTMWYKDYCHIILLPGESFNLAR